MGVTASLVQCPKTTLFLGGGNGPFLGKKRCGCIFKFSRGAPFYAAPRVSFGVKILNVDK